MPDYFTLAELRALPDMSNTTKYPEARVEAAAAAIVGVIEAEVGTSFITRVVVDEVHDGSCPIILDDVWATTVLSATEDGDTITDSLTIKGGVVRRYSGTVAQSWTEGFGNVLVTYEAGYSSAPPADIKRAALKATRLELLSSADTSSANARRTSLSGEMGTESWVVAGENRPTGYPEVDAVILRWKCKLNGPSVA